MTKEKKHEPLFHISKRMEISSSKKWAIRIGSGVLAILVCGLVSTIFTGNFGGFFSSVFSGTFGTSLRRWTLLENLSILLCIALALTPAFKMKFWNIGAEGQVLIGCLFCAICMFYIKNSIPEGLLLIICLLGSVLFGMIWAVIPALFKAKWNTNETLFTLMMNYVAMFLVTFFISAAVRSGSGVLGLQPYGHMPLIKIPGLNAAGQKYLLTIILVFALTAIMYVYLRYSKHGYELSVVGESENTARYIGINVKKVIIRTLLLSGAICGFAGWLLVTGARFTVSKDLVGGDGFTAILVAWLAHFNPIGMIVTAFLVIFLKQGASQLVTDFKLGKDYLGDVIVGIFFLFIIGSEFFINYKISLRKNNAKATDDSQTTTTPEDSASSQIPSAEEPLSDAEPSSEDKNIPATTYSEEEVKG